MYTRGNKCVLIIAPHPDDEINLAGQLSVALIKQGYTLFVLYTTNGDAERKINNKRLYEALSANAVLGIPKENVLFLGYPNEWLENKHIYNAEQKELLVSALGKTQTNSIPEHPEYCYSRFGNHHIFSRENFKHDFKTAILDIYPEIIIAPDFDSHPDHRAASLLFEEIMGEILKTESGYHPYILKKNIHEGVWYGEKDYYKEPLPPTKYSGQKVYAGGKHELDAPNFRWDERVIFQSDGATKTPLLNDNIIYRAAKQHKVTTAWYEMQRVINSDCVYWCRPTNNHALHAKVIVSSGTGRYLNDFKHYDCFDVYNKNDPFERPELFCWKPSLEDAEKEATFLFKCEISVALIRVYEDCNIHNHINKLEIYLDDQFVAAKELEASGARTDIVLPQVQSCKKLTVKIVDNTGNPGLAEVEIYSECDPEQKRNLDGDVSAMGNQKRFVRLKQRIEKLSLMIAFAIKFKIQYEVKRLLKRF